MSTSKRNMTRPNTVTELRDQLLDLFTDIGNGHVDLKVAKELNNSAGKIIKSVSVQIEYAAARDEKPTIEFAR